MHVMLDLETLDTSSTSLILSIGAVAFDKDEIKSEFYRIIAIDQFMVENFKISAATLTWWFKQYDAIREFAKADCTFRDALIDFSSYYAMCNGLALWGNGVDFDNVILANAYKVAKIDQPWKYYHNNCFRTFKNRFPGVAMSFTGVKHNALADARYQAEYLIELNKVNNLNIL